SIILENVFARTFDASKLSEDAERVHDADQQKGYFKALVEDPKTKVRDKYSLLHFPFFQSGHGKVVDITVPIEEGDRYKLNAINFTGNKAISNSKLLRSLFPMKDGEIFNTASVRKGLENLRKAYGEYGYINFTPVPNTKIDDEKKLITLDIDVDEGKQFSVRRIEFQGNTTTRDKVIRRELLLEEGQTYNEQLWKISLQRLNQLGFFEQLKPEDPNVTERHLDEKEGLVDLTLKVKERGKNQIGLSGGVSGLAGSFIGLSYTTNNFLGLGETLSVQANIGTLQRNIMFGFTEPYFLDRQITVGFTVYGQKLIFDQARQAALISGQTLALSQAELQSLQNYTQASQGFTLTASHPLHRSFKRIGATYSFDVSSLVATTTASKQLFSFLDFSGLSGPNALNGIITSKDRKSTRL